MVMHIMFFADADFFKLFPKKDLKNGDKTDANGDKSDAKSVSKLALLVKNFQNQPKNPYAHYGKFDGEVWLVIFSNLRAIVIQ